MLALSDQDRTRVEAAITAAERRTRAQFAVAVAGASDDYALYPVLWAAMAALVIGDIVALAVSGIATLWVVALQAVLFALGDLLFHWRPLRHRLVPAGVKKAHARRLARLEFAAQVERRTTDAVALLLFVSAAERHVEILVDRGIAARIEPAEWDRIIADFTATMSTGAVSTALIGAIEAAAALLAGPFPPQGEGPNPIPDRVSEVGP